jgi:hypothetical protein
MSQPYKCVKRYEKHMLYETSYKLYIIPLPK